jgi:hypothetical protein
VAKEKSCERALAEHEDQLGALPNVTGLGIVPVVEGESGSSNLAVAVYVTHKVPMEELDEDEVIPKRLSYDADGETRWVPVKVIEQGPVSLERGPVEPGETLGKEPPGDWSLGKEPL